MAKFKEMKFWIGDDAELRTMVVGVLTAAGHDTDYIDASGVEAIYVDDDGFVTQTGHTSGRGYFIRKEYKEVNIDWMRTTKPESVEVETPSVMTKEEAEQQISELQSYIEELDKPKRVRVYIKEDAGEVNPSCWVNDMSAMTGKTLDAIDFLKDFVGNGMVVRVLTEGGSNSWLFREGQYVVVEGSLEDLK